MRYGPAKIAWELVLRQRGCCVLGARLGRWAAQGTTICS